MKKIAATTLLALAVSAGAMAASSTAMAGNTKAFTSTMQVPATPVSINVTLGENLAYRADNISDDIRDKFRSRDRRNGFANNGYFGQKDLDRLTKRLKTKMEYRLEKRGFTVSDDAPTVLNLVITDARPNRPTFNQISKSSALSMRSFGIGGAKFKGSLTSADGEQGAVSYGWYETDIRWAAGSGTWTDAERAIDKFSRKVAKSFR